METVAALTVLSCLLFITSVECQEDEDYYSANPAYDLFCARPSQCSEERCETDSGTNLLCRCDRQCDFYGDCCAANSTEICGHHEEQNTLDGLLECRSIHLDVRTKPDWTESFWMVSACPSDWLAGREDRLLLYTLRNCTAGSPDLPPVTDIETGLVYKNEYCAVCHEVQRFAQWGYRLECSPALRQMAQSPDFQVTAEIVERECITCAFRPPTSVPPPRACLHPSLIDDSCLAREELLERVTEVPIAEETYQEIVRQCQSGPIGPLVLGEPVEHFFLVGFGQVERRFDEFPYRNQYCALCNGIRVNAAIMTCVDPYMVRNSTNHCRQEAANITLAPTPSETPQPLPPDDFNITDISKPFVIEGEPVPFTIFLDVNGDSQVVSVENRTVTITITCEEGQLFDPINQRCRDTICPELARGEPCAIVEDLMRLGMTTDNSSLPCELENAIFLTEDDDFIILDDNQTVMFGDEVFQLGYINGTLAICTNFNRTGTLEKVITVLIYSYPMAFSIVTSVGCSLSVIGCAFVLLTYSLFKELRTLPGRILMNLSATILATSAFLLVGFPLFALSEKEELCHTTAIFLHWLVLSQFSWMTVISYELARTFLRASQLKQTETKAVKGRMFLLYMLIGWGLPTAMTGVSTIVNYTTDYIGYGEDGFCWIGHTESFYALFLAPVALSILTNGVLFCITTYLLFRAQWSEAKLQKQKTNPYFRIYVSIFSVTGLTWVFGFVAILARDDWAWYLFISLTSTQGFTICVAFLFTQKIASLYMQFFWSKVSGPISYLLSSKQPVPDTSNAVRYVRKDQHVSTEYTSTNGSEIDRTTAEPRDSNARKAGQEAVQYVNVERGIEP